MKQDLPNKPKMVVVKKVSSIFKHDPKRIEDKKSTLKGIKCMWFTTTGELQEYVFNTKDIQIID
jgi:hypothetical protein